MKRSNFFVVADADDGCARQSFKEEIVERFFRFGIKGVRCFIQEKELRFLKEDACERDALLFAGRELLRPVDGLLQSISKGKSRQSRRT